MPQLHSPEFRSSGVVGRTLAPSCQGVSDLGEKSKMLMKLPVARANILSKISSVLSPPSMMSLGVANGQALSLESLHRREERREFEDDFGVVDAPRGHRGSEALLQLERCAESCEGRQGLRETPTRPPASPAYPDAGERQRPCDVRSRYIPT